MKKKMIFCGVHLPDDTLDTIKEHAEIYGRSVSGEIRVLVRDALAQRLATTFEFAKPKSKK